MYHDQRLRGWTRSRASVYCIFGLTVVLALVFGVTKASAATGSNPYTKPTWWPKYQVVSAPGFRPLARSSAGSVSVGANVDVSNEPGPQSETSIAIDPANPKQVVAGSNEIFRLPMRGYFSSDGGKTWGAVDLPLPPPLNGSGTDFGSDPAVAWDTQGHVFYAYIVVFFNHGFNAITGTEMAVARSSDAGRTWTSTFFNFNSGSGKFNDKPYIAVDTNPGSPFRDTVYVAWDNASLRNGQSSANNVILVSRSTDGGQTFSTPVVASGTGSGPRAVIGADPFVAPDGTLHVAWHDIKGNQIVEAASTDGGLTFGPTHLIAPTQAAFDVAIPAQQSRHALVYPACGADTSTGPNRGALYCSWMDETQTNGTDVFVSRSSDAGVNWGQPVRVNDDPTGVANDQFNQWLAVDPATGSVDLSWNDTRNDPTHLSTDIFFAQSTDGGASFGPNVQVTTAPTNETCCGADLGNQYGDYEGIAALGGTVHPVWTDRRASVVSQDEEVFTATLK
jgi:hypothetical protein